MAGIGTGGLFPFRGSAQLCEPAPDLEGEIHCFIRSIGIEELTPVSHRLPLVNGRAHGHAHRLTFGSNGELRRWPEFGGGLCLFFHCAIPAAASCTFGHEPLLPDEQ